MLLYMHIYALHVHNFAICPAQLGFCQMYNTDCLRTCISRDLDNRWVRELLSFVRPVIRLISQLT